MSFVLSLFLMSYYGASFLTLYPGAQPTGMGGATTAIADNSYSVFYNPAGLGFQRILDVSFERNPIPWHDKPNHWDISAVVPLHNNYNLGLFGAGVKFNHSLNEHEHQYAIGLAFGYQFLNIFCIGFSVKSIKQTYSYWDFFDDTCFTNNAHAYASDIGVLGKFANEYGLLGCGMVLQNLGTKIKYSQTNETDPLPMSLRGGVAYTLNQNNNILSNDWRKSWLSLNWQITIAYDINMILTKHIADSVNAYDENPWHSLGAEIKPFPALSMRVGYFYDKNPNGQDIRKGLTYGIGFNLKFIRLDVSEDMPFFYLPNLIERYRITLSVTLGEPYLPKNGILSGLIK